MTIEFLILTILGLTAYSFFLSKRKASALNAINPLDVHSQPHYHGLFSAILTIAPAIILLFLWSWLENSIFKTNLESYFSDVVDPYKVSFYVSGVKSFVAGASDTLMNHSNFSSAVEYYETSTKMSLALKSIVIVIITLITFRYSLNLVTAKFKARDLVEDIVIRTMKYASIFAIFITLGIVLSLLFETLRFFESVAVTEFLFGTHWSPQMSIREGQVGSSGSFGAVPVFTGTLLISLIAMLVAGPIGLFSAIYLSQYASNRVRSYAKPIIEILAGIPTVVYGFFAVITVGPFFRDLGIFFNIDGFSSESALIAGSVLGIMIIPFIASLTDDSLSAVPRSLKEGSLAMGATLSETTTRVIIPASFHGIVGSFLLAFSRAIGETMIVVMAAGFAANLTANPFNAVTTVTVQIVGLLTGDQEFDSAKTMSAFALAFVLFFLTLILNIISLSIVKKFREQYE
tara:strand:- start:5134 stop:6510 length:1377 start_codon:yes stop_codon:yes gene_type:complete